MCDEVKTAGCTPTVAGLQQTNRLSAFGFLHSSASNVEAIQRFGKYLSCHL
jgi:hypothetical protein